MNPQPQWVGRPPPQRAQRGSGEGRGVQGAGCETSHRCCWYVYHSLGTACSSWQPSLLRANTPPGPLPSCLDLPSSSVPGYPWPAHLLAFLSVPRHHSLLDLERTDSLVGLGPGLHASLVHVPIWSSAPASLEPQSWPTGGSQQCQQGQQIWETLKGTLPVCVCPQGCLFRLVSQN